MTCLSYVITEQLFADEICDPSELRDYRAAVCGWIMLPVLSTRLQSSCLWMK